MLLSAAIEFPYWVERLQNAIIENPPVVIRDGGVIADGYDAELDDLRSLSENAGDYLVKLEEREKPELEFLHLKSATIACMAITLKYPKAKPITHQPITFADKPLKC